ncbi:methyltransferase domain-containing protein [Streptomyces marincola]|uniref:methyltransferase domain-containing protein n=1 Tax=Streptomyces marincola TaxID=2878388 RepID=UPI001CF336C0|nr:methyltransferase domain-containing protein [Streptomyces marincola]UCM89400.1 methyltransferase domain-containing protein [Streptomyces marincola]
MSLIAPPAPDVAQAAAAVPERHYTHHTGRGETAQRSNPLVVQRELTTLEVTEGMNVLEIGTGSGYSGALLSHLVGKDGSVTSIDIDPYLARWANLIHHQHGIDNVRCHPADGTRGHPGQAPYDRLVAWCTPPLLPRSWVEQMTDGGLIVTPLPIAAVPKVTVVVRIRVTAGTPHVEEIHHGGYVETSTGGETDSDVPLRWVDWENRLPAPSWISLARRAEDDWKHTAARAALDLLRVPGHTEAYRGAAVDWTSWRTFAAAIVGPHLTVAGLAPEALALGHSAFTTAAVLQDDGTILADAPDSASLTALHDWLARWEEAGRPSPEAYTPALNPHTGPDGIGWDLRLTR